LRNAAQLRDNLVQDEHAAERTRKVDDHIRKEILPALIKQNTNLAKQVCNAVQQQLQRGAGAFETEPFLARIALSAGGSLQRVVMERGHDEKTWMRHLSVWDICEAFLRRKVYRRCKPIQARLQVRGEPEKPWPLACGEFRWAAGVLEGDVLAAALDYCARLSLALRQQGRPMSWWCPVGALRDADPVPDAGPAQAVLLEAAPIRVEDFEDDESTAVLDHPMLGDFLVARAIAADGPAAHRAVLPSVCGFGGQGQAWLLGAGRVM
jgi:hypothetical protein